MAAKWNGRLGAIPGEGKKPFASAACQEDSKSVFHVCAKSPFSAVCPYGLNK
jgi:hypothetical protein